MKLGFDARSGVAVIKIAGDGGDVAMALGMAADWLSLLCPTLRAIADLSIGCSGHAVMRRCRAHSGLYEKGYRGATLLVFLS